VGVGVNVRAPTDSYPAALRSRVISLSEVAPAPPELEDVEEAVVGAARSALSAIATRDGAREILSECRAALHGVGRSATVDRNVRGVIRSLGESGELLLDTPSGALAIHSGDVVVEEA